MEPRLRNSSGPVEAMPKHKQAGHTTVLTKYAQTAQQNACNAGATHTCAREIRAPSNSQSADLDEAAAAAMALVAGVLG